MTPPAADPGLPEPRARPAVEVSFRGGRAAAAFLAQALALPEIAGGVLELTGAGRRYLLRLRVDSWRRAPAEPTETSLATRLLHLAREAGGTVLLAADAVADDDTAAARLDAELADLAAEVRAIRADVERLRRLARQAASEDELGWEAPEWVDGALRLGGILAAAAEPLGRLVAILEGEPTSVDGESPGEGE